MYFFVFSIIQAALIIHTLDSHTAHKSVFHIGNSQPPWNHGLLV